MTRRLLQGLVYSNIFISFCALMMTWETLQHVGSMNTSMLFFVFFATMVTYHFHALINIVYEDSSNRSRWNTSNRQLLLFMLALAMIGTLYFFLPFASDPFPFLVAALLTFLYSAPNMKGRFFEFLRSIAVGKTIYLAGMWTYATTILPAMAVAHPHAAPPYAFIACRFFLIYPICILFDRRDKLEDREKGIRALPTVLGDRPLKTIYFTSLLLSLFFAFASHWPKVDHDTLILLAPALICLPLYHFTINRKDEFLYYVLLDGLMMLSAILQAIYLISITFVTR